MDKNVCVISNDTAVAKRTLKLDVVIDFLIKACDGIKWSLERIKAYMQDAKALDASSENNGD